MARILEEETGKGAFPAVLHCFTGGRDLAQRAIALGLFISFTGILTFKKSDDLRAIAQEPAGGSHPGRDRCALSCPRPASRQAQRAGLRGRDRQGAGRDARRRTTRSPGRRPRTSFACSARSRQAAVERLRRRASMTLKFTILGCGSSGGVPRPALGWGACDPGNPRNRRRRTSLLVERRNGNRRHPRPGRYLARPARAAARRRGRLARRRALHP